MTYVLSPEATKERRRGKLKFFRERSKIKRTGSLPKRLFPRRGWRIKTARTRRVWMNGSERIVQESTEPFVLSFVTDEGNRNVNGTVHGGDLFYLCDEIVGRYVTRCGRKGAAADGSIRYYRPARIGEKLFVTIAERKVGKRLGTYLTELRNSDGALIADAMITIAFLDGESGQTGPRP